MCNNMPYNFAFCVNDGYVPYICVTITSIIENHRGIKKAIYVLSDKVSERNRYLLEEVVADDQDTCLKIVIVDDTPLQGLKDTWPIYAWYRLLIPNYLPKEVHKILYLDADTVVCGDLTSLFKIEMSDYSVAGCLDPETFNQETFDRCGYDMNDQYLCSGVLLMNLDFWRKHQLAQKMISYAREYNDRIKFPDQDTINILCKDTKIILPLRYGIMDYFLKEERFYKEPYRTQLQECLENPAIVHYAGQNPWKRELATAVMQEEWDRYNQMLKHPAKKVYITKGWLLFKMLIWNALHPNCHAHRTTKEDILRKIEQTK